MSPLHFPNAKKIVKCLRNHPLLDHHYYNEKGITKAIAKLAAKRFANSDNVEMGVKIGAMLIINDLQSGVDNSTGKPLPNLDKVVLSNMAWIQLSIATEAALLDCANKM